ncbi:MAG: STAS domain-containing protein [Cycloclasticus sp.]|nr:STAS domain-containing protein [Cycloclasticus sp.]
MSNAALEKNEEGIIDVSGTLGFGLVADLLLSSRHFFAGQGDLVFNLAGVEKADSAGLALLVEWMVMAERSGRAICFQEMPKQMLDIARVSGLDEILPIV